MKAEEILKELNIQEDVLNIYQYGSTVYGNSTEESDQDYIIVAKSAMLSNGAFRNNAISNKDRTIQAVLYSRGGFQDAINNYEIGALECLFLEDDFIVKKRWPFKLHKIVDKDLAKKIITKSSASWHSADLAWQHEDIVRSKKGIYHALRILEFGKQIKENGRIVDYSSTNKLKEQINSDSNFRPSNWNSKRVELTENLKSQ